MTPSNRTSGELAAGSGTHIATFAFGHLLFVPMLLCALRTAAAGGFAERLRPWRAICLCLGLSMILGPLIVSGLKYLAAAHCPADLTIDGGTLDYATDRSAPLFAASRASAGHCVPSGHAGGGYALLSLCFAGWAAGRPRWRCAGLAIGILAGLSFSLVRLLQGAHFASQTVWSAPIDWVVAGLVFMLILFGGWTGGRAVTDDSGPPRVE